MGKNILWGKTIRITVFFEYSLKQIIFEKKLASWFQITSGIVYARMKETLKTRDDDPSTDDEWKRINNSAQDTISGSIAFRIPIKAFFMESQIDVSYMINGVNIITGNAGAFQLNYNIGMGVTW